MVPPTRAAALLALLVAASSALACGPEAPRPAASERERVLGPFLSAHWRIPAGPQGPRPSGTSEAVATLQPAICGACHPEQYADWRGSLHAQAASPGLLGQLIEGDLSRPQSHRVCMSCHAPLDEQQLWDSDLRPNARFDSELRAHGLLCAGCHVRSHRFFGPPRRDDAPTPPDPPPHGGFETRPEYHESRFCAECHQFFDDPGPTSADGAGGSKPIQNTYFEWLASPQAAEGRQCQDCHMPDRRHLWRGIHDPEMVRAAVDVDLLADDLGGETLRASLLLTSRDVGHAFPTYVTPRVFVSIHQEDAERHEIEGTRVAATIGREVDLSTGTEIFDTRIAPGQSVKLDYSEARVERAASLVGRVTVDPDFHYRGVFSYLDGSLRDPQARALNREAGLQISDSAYVLAEIRRPLPAAR
ncbi:MAG: hypothetical protein JRG76_16205 [Deltaproteobacteria bacterium]|nr:hypothetical protein [Deltaproteobacteria bacterium]